MDRSAHDDSVENVGCELTGIMSMFYLSGGSILSGLSTFKRMWVSSEEWNEDPDISQSTSSCTEPSKCLLSSITAQFTRRPSDQVPRHLIRKLHQRSV